MGDRFNSELWDPVERARFQLLHPDPRLLENIAMSVMPVGRLSGIGGLGAKAVEAELKAVPWAAKKLYGSAKAVVSAVRKVPEAVRSSWRSHMFSNAERNLKVAEQALDAAKKAKGVRPEVLSDLNRSLMERRYDMAAQHVYRENAKAAAKASAPASGGGTVYRASTADDFYREASKKLYGAETSMRASVRQWIAAWPGNHPKIVNAAGWGALAAQGVGAGAWYASVPDETVPVDNERVRSAQTSVDAIWNGTTNSANMAAAFSDGAAVKRMLADIDRAAVLHIRKYDGTNGLSDPGQVERARSIHDRAIESLKGSDGWNEALTEANSRRNEWVTERVRTLPMGDYDENVRTAESEFDAMSEEDRIRKVN